MATELPAPNHRCAGYLIGVAGAELERSTDDFIFALVVSARMALACQQPWSACYTCREHAVQRCRARASHAALPQVPERRACPDRAETDVNKHDESFSEEVLRVSGMLFRGLCPKACIVRCVHIALACESHGLHERAAALCSVALRCKNCKR